VYAYSDATVYKGNPGFVQQFGITATYSPFVLSLSKGERGRSWFDKLTTSGNVAVIPNTRT